MSYQVYLNGDYIPHNQAMIHAEDRGFNFADGLYEVFRIYGGVPFTLDRHVRRMEEGARMIRLDYGCSAEDFEEIVRELVMRNRMPEAFAYIQVTRGRAPRNHLFPEKPKPTVFVMVKPVTAMSEEERLAGASCITQPDRRYSYCSVKTVGLLPNVLARQEAHEAGALEAILVRDGLVTEGSNTNVFMVKDGQVRTFPVVNILPGITRSVILDLCQEGGIPLSEEAFPVKDLMEADEVFITGSVMEIMPILQVDGRPIGDGRAGPVTRKLIDLYVRRVERDCGQYHPPQ